MDTIIKEGNFKDCAVWMAMVDAKARGDREEVKRLGKQVLEGYIGALDYPAMYFYEELMEIFPNAKCVLSTREAEAWYRSVSDTLYAIRRCADPTWMLRLVPPVKTFNGMVDYMLWDGPHSLFQGQFTDKEVTCKRFNDWNAEVECKLAKERRCTFSAKQGYGPLCEFLAKAAPDEKFPHVNETKRFEDEMKKIKRIDFVGKFVVFPTLVVLVAFGMHRLLR